VSRALRLTRTPNFWKASIMALAIAGPPLAARLGSAVTSPTATAVSIRWSINDFRPIRTFSIFDPSSSPRAGLAPPASMTPSAVASGKTRHRDGTMWLSPAGLDLFIIPYRG